MNAVVLTAVLSCLNSGLYTASRMLFVLAARREAPVQLIRVTDKGVPRNAILFSTVVGFLCVIAAAVSEKTVFLFLLNSSGAIILFVYLLICVSQVILRRRTDASTLRVKMWLFPGLSLLTIVGIVAVLVQMGLTAETASQLWLSLLAWAVVLAFYLVTRWRGGSVDRRRHSTAAAPDGAAHAACSCSPTRPSRPTSCARSCRRIDDGGHGRLLRLRARQPRRHRPGRAQGRRLHLGGDRRGGPVAARLHPRVAAALPVSTPTGRSGTTVR